LASKPHSACFAISWLDRNLRWREEAAQMNKLLIVLASVFLIGCAHQEKVTYTAPSVVAVKTGVEKLRQYVRPEGQTAVKELSDAITTYQKQVDDQSLALVKAQEEAVYWNAKQVKALKELWLWRGIAIFSITCVVGYIGIKTSWKFLV
jgi:outer membrane murein-binding lipoprotein Lpp